MNRKPIAWVVALLLLVGVLSGVFAGGNASARADQQNPPSKSQEQNSLFLPILTKNFPFETVFGAELDWISAETGLTQMEATDMTWTRRHRLIWSDVEPGKGDRLWDASLDQELQAAAAANLQTVLVIYDTPGWAQAFSGSSCGPIKSTEYAAFAAFVHDAVARYSAWPYNIDYYEIWNEPDAPLNYANGPFGCWGDTNDPDYFGGKAYGDMLNVVYPQVKSASSGAQVLVGGLLLDCDPEIGLCTNPNSSNFLAGILQSSSSFDGVSFHAYDYYNGSLGGFGNANWGTAWNTTGPVVTAKAQFIQDTLAGAGVTGKYLVNTESAIITDSTCDATCETTKAYYLVQAYATAIAQQLKGNIWYTALGWRNSGLLNPDLSPKLAYTSFSFARAELQNASFVSAVSLDPNVKGYQFSRSGQSILVLWSLDGADHTVTLPWVPAHIWDSFGSGQPVTGTSYTVTKQPVYFDRYP